jgi:hypothetical protein
MPKRSKDLLGISNSTSNANLSQKNICFLVSSESGVAYYEVQRKRYRLDLLTNQHLEVGRSSAYSDVGEGQCDYGLYFVTLSELVAFVHHQHLKNEKETSYAVLFTRVLKHRPLLKALSFLDQPKLFLIQISSALVNLLEEIADPQLVAEVMKRASDLRLENVKFCLANDFRHLIFHHGVVSALQSLCNSASSEIIEEFESMRHGPSLHNCKLEKIKRGRNL